MSDRAASCFDYNKLPQEVVRVLEAEEAVLSDRLTLRGERDRCGLYWGRYYEARLHCYLRAGGLPFTQF